MDGGACPMRLGRPKLRARSHDEARTNIRFSRIRSWCPSWSLTSAFRVMDFLRCLTSEAQGSDFRGNPSTLKGLFLPRTALDALAVEVLVRKRRVLLLPLTSSDEKISTGELKHFLQGKQGSALSLVCHKVAEVEFPPTSCTLWWAFARTTTVHS